MEWWHVYLFTRLDSLHALITLVLVVLLLGTLVTGILWYFDSAMGVHGEKYITAAAKGKKAFVRILALATVVALVRVSVPTQKEAAAIYLLPKLAHSDFAKEAQQIPTDAAKLLRMKLESWISDMEPKAKKK